MQHSLSCMLCQMSGPGSGHTCHLWPNVWTKDLQILRFDPICLDSDLARGGQIPPNLTSPPILGGPVIVSDRRRPFWTCTPEITYT
ncbi:hypothetical protein DAEQUDRAFT_519257 [Daedalea quercina L-15889]|uniref:Uncharacterized protein n=1 Tax=Daedalea quercina L-15889 TaxID=1314783 RepID=A0A165MED5_9APHY|nr:hypothetical protein DAEQUDRAFT_519257 [Daedalea quercina L-15889]